jgi:arylsulfatase A-like enzyme
LQLTSVHSFQAIVFTSQLPHSSGVTVLETPLADDRVTLATQLGASGYQPAVFGKMHFNQPGRRGLHGFEIADTEDVVGRDWLAQVGPAPDFGDILTKPIWRPFKDPARIWLDADKLPFPRKYDDMEGTWIARRAVRYMKEHKNDSFALWVSFMEPHSPFNFPVEDRKDFSPDSFVVPEVGPRMPIKSHSSSGACRRGISRASSRRITRPYNSWTGTLAWFSMGFAGSIWRMIRSSSTWPTMDTVWGNTGDLRNTLAMNRRCGFL